LARQSGLLKCMLDEQNPTPVHNNPRIAAKPSRLYV
jgi:hypothetical protein